MTTQELASTFRKAGDTIECLLYENTKFRKMLENINQRDDVTDDLRHYILDVLTGKGKERLN